MTNDHRIIPARTDIAANHLFGEVKAEKFVEGEPHRVVVGLSNLHFKPDSQSRVESQLLYGETFIVYEDADNWCWGQLTYDNYVGYVRKNTLALDPWKETHLVSEPGTYIYSEPDIKQPPKGFASISSPVEIICENDGFSKTSDGNWLFTKHLIPINSFGKNYIQYASKLLGTPYLWGGRSFHGLDCSSFLQIVCRLSGIHIPRDSDQQESVLGIPVEFDPLGDFSALRKGDVVFFPGHVGIYIDNEQFLHANAFDMQVTIHNFTDVLDRAERAKSRVTSVRRLF